MKTSTRLLPNRSVSLAAISHSWPAERDDDPPEVVRELPVVQVGTERRSDVQGRVAEHAAAPGPEHQALQALVRCDGQHLGAARPEHGGDTRECFGPFTGD